LDCAAENPAAASSSATPARKVLWVRGEEVMFGYKRYRSSIGANRIAFARTCCGPVIGVRENLSLEGGSFVH
jgi:hypothetical protein